MLRMQNPRAKVAAGLSAMGGLPQEPEPYSAAGMPSGGMAPGARTSSATTPAAAPAPPKPETDPNPHYQAAIDAYPRTKGGGPGASRRALRQMSVGNAYRANEGLWDALAELAAQSNPENLAGSYGQQYEQMDDYFDQAQGTLDRSLMERGLSDSSAAVGGQVGLARGRAEASAGLSNQIHGEARQRGDMLRQALMGLASGNAAMGGNLANTALAQKLQREQMKAQQGDWLDSLLGLAGSGAQIARYT